VKGVVLAAVAALSIAGLLTPVVRNAATWLGAIDTPGGRRMHKNATPRMGGVAIVMAFWCAIGLCFAVGWLNNHLWESGPLWGFFAGSVLIAGCGAVDDIKPIGAKKKLAVQILAASIAWYGGARIVETLGLPLVGDIQISPVISYLATVVWILAFTNAINLIDGLDGLAAGVVFFACLTNLVVAIVAGNTLAATINAALGAAVLGFLFYNFNPATIFMGDTGSMFLGFVLGSAALLSGRQKESTLVSLLVPIIALGLPLTDTLLAMARRFFARRSIFSADREHLHHRLIDLGLTHRRTVLLLYGCSVMLCLAAVAAAFGKDWQVGAALVGAVLTLMGMTKFTTHFELVLSKKLRRLKLLEGSAASLRRIVPDLIVRVHKAGTSFEVWSALEQALQSSEVVVAAECGPTNQAATWRWEAPAASGRSEGRLNEAEFMLGVFPGRRDRLVFTCLTDDVSLPPQTEIQFQLIADVLQTAFMRIHTANPRELLRQVEDHSEEALVES
jgi:UDP-GlcNAc:undecaprenyl-phosphate/decaprenyl-phosphate GlcNAc-1-phosphate transferase